MSVSSWEFKSPPRHLKNRAGGSSSAVECLLAKEEVASSNLVFRSSGDVAKWQGGGLQNPYSPVRIRSSPLLFHKSFTNPPFFALRPLLTPNPLQTASLLLPGAPRGHRNKYQGLRCTLATMQQDSKYVTIINRRLLRKPDSVGSRKFLC